MRIVMLTSEDLGWPQESLLGRAVFSPIPEVVREISAENPVDQII
jgi:hypothetical protein